MLKYKKKSTLFDTVYKIKINTLQRNTQKIVTRKFPFINQYNKY